jgi:hypothetical protein
MTADIKLIIDKKAVAVLNYCLFIYSNRWQRFMKVISKKTKLILLFSIPLFLLCIKGFTMANAADKQLYYGVDIDLHNVGVDIRVNDIPVYFDDSKGQLIVEIPVPDSIIDGENTLSINTFLPIKTSVYEEGAYATVTLFQQDLAIKNSKKIKLSTVTLKLDNQNAIASVEDYVHEQKGVPTVQLNQDKSAFVQVSTTISSPFPRWAWQDGKTIEDNQVNYDSLVQAYQKIHNALATKDLAELKRLYSKRSNEIAIAYHLADEEAGHEKLSVGVDMTNDALELRDLYTKNMKLYVFCGGKLARISTHRNTQPIYYLQENPRLLHLYKFMFYLNEDNEWIMIR